MPIYKRSQHASGGTKDVREAVRAMTDARLHLAGLLPPGYQTHPATQDFVERCDVHHMAQLALRSCGVDEWRDLSPSKTIDLALSAKIDALAGLRGGGQGSVTLPGILANIYDAAMMIGWERVPHAWRKIVRVTEASDFRRATRAGLSELDLVKVGENGEMESKRRSDYVEYITGEAYVGNFNVTRQAIVNDDIGALEKVAHDDGVAASAAVNREVFSLLISNAGVGPTLNQSGRALFNSTDGNYTASGGPITVQRVSVGRRAMRLQQDPMTGRRLNIAPKILLVPPSLEEEGRVVAAASHIPGSPDNLEVVCEAALEDGTNGPTAWYLLADPEITDTLEVAFIGHPSPRVERRQGQAIDGIHFKVGIDFGVAALAHRGAYRNKGA